MRILHFTTAANKRPVALFPDQYLRKMTGTHNLWELRTKYQNKQFRIFIAKIDTEAAVLLHAIVKKTRKTPPQDIHIAEARLKSIRLAEKG